MRLDLRNLFIVVGPVLSRREDVVGLLSVGAGYLSSILEDGKPTPMPNASNEALKQVEVVVLSPEDYFRDRKGLLNLDAMSDETILTAWWDVLRRLKIAVSLNVRCIIIHAEQNPPGMVTEYVKSKMADYECISIGVPTVLSMLGCIRFAKGYHLTGMDIDMQAVEPYVLLSTVNPDHDAKKSVVTGGSAEAQEEQKAPVGAEKKVFIRKGPNFNNSDQLRLLKIQALPGFEKNKVALLRRALDTGEAVKYSPSLAKTFGEEYLIKCAKEIGVVLDFVE